MTNVSGGDYELPKSFRFMRKSSDGVLHADENVERTEPNFIPELSFPEQRYFPAGHTTAFVVSFNRYLSDHKPSTDEDKRQLGKQLLGTRSYVLFDEKHRCEIELPVSSKVMTFLP